MSHFYIPTNHWSLSAVWLIIITWFLIFLSFKLRIFFSLKSCIYLLLIKSDHRKATRPIWSQNNFSLRRYVQSEHPGELPSYNTFNSLPPAGLEEPNQVELLMMENERLRQELEAHREKTGRIQKVRSWQFPSEIPQSWKRRYFSM